MEAFESERMRSARQYERWYEYLTLIHTDIFVDMHRISFNDIFVDMEPDRSRKRKCHAELINRQF